MRTLYEFWLRQFNRQPVVIVPIICLFATIVMNAETGIKLANGAWIMGVIVGAFAVWTAYCGTRVFDRSLGTGKWLMFLVCLVFGLAVDQVSSWQSMGLQFADARVARSTEAMGLATSTEELQRYREERAKIGTTRALKEIEPDRNLECEKRSKSYPDGVGPRCSALRSEYGKAERAAELDRLIKEALVGVETRKQTSEAGSELAVPQQIAQAFVSWWSPRASHKVTNNDVLFWILLVISITIALVANLGFAMCGVHGAGDGDGDRIIDLKPNGGGGGGGGGGIEDVARGFVPVLSAPLPQARLEAPRQAAYASPAGAPGGAASASSPITINLGLPGGMVPVLGANDSGSAAGASVVGPTASGVVSAPRSRRDLPALPGGIPVDRSKISRQLDEHERAAADVMLHFRSACVVDAPGGLVSVRNLFKRYAKWAGERAVDEMTFPKLFSEVTGIRIVPISGLEHAHDVALRIGSALSAVEAPNAA